MKRWVNRGNLKVGDEIQLDGFQMDSPLEITFLYRAADGGVLGDYQTTDGLGSGSRWLPPKVARVRRADETPSNATTSAEATL